MNTSTATTQNYGAGASRLSRRLIEIGEYARREGITPQDVHRCCEIGILQLRRHKDKTFVVDMPISSFDSSDDIDAEVARMLGITEEKQAAVNTQAVKPQPEIQTEEPKPAIQPGSISQLVQEMLSKAEKIKQEEKLLAGNSQPSQNAKTQTVKELSPATKELLNVMQRQLDQFEQKTNLNNKA
ncbi:MAG: hypothetical protein WC476_11940 [Phycisphaerae bacterium]|jgi:hypothetical protein